MSKCVHSSNALSSIFISALVKALGLFMTFAARSAHKLERHRGPLRLLADLCREHCLLRQRGDLRFVDFTVFILLPSMKSIAAAYRLRARVSPYGLPPRFRSAVAVSHGYAFATPHLRGLSPHHIETVAATPTRSYLRSRLQRSAPDSSIWTSSSKVALPGAVPSYSFIRRRTLQYCA